MAPTLDELLARFDQFDPSMAGWLQTVAEVPEDLLEAIETRVFAQVPVASRKAPLTWAQIKKPKPWMRAWVRTLAPDGAKLTPKRCAELGESPLLPVAQRLELRGTKKVDGEALAALFGGSASQRADLEHFVLRPDPKKTSVELGRVVAEHLGTTIQSLDVDSAVLEGILDARVDFPRLRHLGVSWSGTDARRLASRLVAWPPFSRLTSISTTTDEALIDALEDLPARPPFERLEVDGPLARALLPDCDALEHLVCVRSAGVLDALARHPRIRLRSLSANQVLSDELADYFRSSNADALESFALDGYGVVTRRACCEAMASSKARPIEVRLGRLSVAGGRRLLQSDFFQRTRRLQVQTLDTAVVDALLEHPPPQLEALIATVDEGDVPRLQAKLGTRARVHAHYTAPDPLDPTLRFALEQLDRVNGTAHAGNQGVATLQQLWWEQDNLAHDAHHCGVSGVRWQALRALDGLEHAPKLRTLVAPHSNVDSLDPVANAPLHTVNVASNRRLRSLAPLASSSTLCELDISHTAVRDLSPLQSIASLQKLTAVGLELFDEQLAVLADLRRRGVELVVESERTRTVDALAYPAEDGAGSDGAALLRDAELPALADEWETHGPDSRDATGLPIALRAFAAVRRDLDRRRELVCGLVQAGADVNAESLAAAETLLSASVGDPELCNRLLDLGADPNLPEASPAVERLLDRGKTRDRALVDRLIEAGAAMTPSAFAKAAALDDLPLVQRALAQGLDVHADDMGRPLERAATGRSTAVVAALLEAGADPTQGLPHARSLEVYDQLVLAGAPPTARTVFGNSILEELATFCADDDGVQELVGAVVRDGVSVTGALLGKAVERARNGGRPFFEALAAAGASLDLVWYAWNHKKNIHQPRTLRDQRQHPDLQAFAKAQKIPTGASRIKAMLKRLAEPEESPGNGHALWRDVLALADLLPGPDAHNAPRDVLPDWIGRAAEHARERLPDPLHAALAPLAPTHPAVLLVLAQGVTGTTPSGKGLLTLACEIRRSEAPGLAAMLSGLLDAGAPIDVGHPLPLETYLQAAQTHAAELSADLVGRLMHPQARTRSAYFWLAAAMRGRVDDRPRVLAAFDEADGDRSSIRDVALTTYAEIGDLERTIRAAEGQHRTTLTHALNQALQADHLPVVDALLERGAAPNFHARGTNPALFWARSAGAIRRLARAGARVDAGGRQRPAAAIIRLVSHEPHLIEVVEALIGAGASLSDVEPMSGQTLQAQLRALGRQDVDAWLDA